MEPVTEQLEEKEVRRGYEAACVVCGALVWQESSSNDPCCPKCEEQW